MDYSIALAIFFCILACDAMAENNWQACTLTEHGYRCPKVAENDPNDAPASVSISGDPVVNDDLPTKEEIKKIYNATIYDTLADHEARIRRIERLSSVKQ